MLGFVSRLADGPPAKSAGIPHGRMFCLDTARPENGCAHSYLAHPLTLTWMALDL